MKHLSNSDFQENNLINVPTPVNDRDAANKEYVDELIVTEVEVDNTEPADRPTLWVDTSEEPESITKASIGLGNVDNMSFSDIKTAILEATFYVGFILIEHTGVNPGTRYGVGTWALTSVGRSIIGVDSGDSDFNTPGKTGGAKTHSLSVGEMPTHSHDIRVRWYTVNTTGGSVTAVANVGGATTYNSGNDTDGTTRTSGGGAAHNNMHPYQAEYVWRRIA